MFENTIYGFADEDTARRTVRAVSYVESLRVRGDDRLFSENKAKVRVVTGTITVTPTPPVAWTVKNGELVIPSNSGSAVNGYLTVFTGIAILYPASLPAPSVGTVLEAEVYSTDDNGVALWVVLSPPSASTVNNSIVITSATLVTPGGSDEPYYPASEQKLVGGTLTTGSACRAINYGSLDPKNGKRYPATYVGFASDGVTRCYAIKAGKTKVLTDVTITCNAGTISVVKDSEFLATDVW